MLTDQGIAARRIRYRCCGLDYLDRAIEARIHGDAACYELNRRKWLWMMWAAQVMDDTPIDGDEHSGCTLLPFASDVADKADCLCDVCGCAEPPPVDCTITPDHTVLAGVAFSNLPLSPAVDDSYYILSGTNAGDIATWDGSDWVFTPVADNEVVYASTTFIYYTNLGAGPGLLFPNPLLINVAAGAWVVSSDSPQTYNGRTLQLQGLGPNGWYNIDIPRNESTLPFGFIWLIGLTINDLRFKYTLADDCVYYSGLGSFDPPPLPCAITQAFSVAQVVDASQQGTLPDGTYFIVSNQFSVTNTWSANVGKLVTVSGLTSFTTIADYTVVYDLQQQVYWWLTPNGAAPLFTPFTITQTLTEYVLTSDYPQASAAGNRFVSVEVLTPSGWTIFWGGYEYDLPQTMPLFASFTDVRVTYVYPGNCLYTVPGTFVPLTGINEIVECGDGLDFAQLMMSSFEQLSQTTITYTSSSPLETLTMTFISGMLPAVVNILFYDGDGGAQIDQVIGPQDFNGQIYQVSSTGDELYITFSVTPPIDWPPTPLWWQIGCSTGNPPIGATATPVDDCILYEFSLDIDVTSTGAAASISIGYSVDGASEVIVPNVGPGTTTIGPFPYESEVIVRLISDEPNPADDITLGIFTSGGSCTNSNNPCAPDAGFKVNQLGDLSELPVDPGLPSYGFFVTSDNTNIGTWPIGALLGWDDVNEIWFSVSYTPGIIISDGTQFWVAGGVGVQPYNAFPVPVLSPTGGDPLNWTIFAAEILLFSMSINTPFTLQVRNGFGTWTDVFSGTLQQMNTPLGISILQPFTQARMVWFYEDECGFLGGVMINLD